MKIALFYPWVYLKGGIEKVIIETIKRSRHEWVIFTNHYSPDTTFPEFSNIKIVTLKDVPVTRDFLSVIWAGFVVLCQKLPLTGYDLLFVHSDGVGDFITFRNNSKPIISFCHTPLRVFFDKHYLNVYLAHNKSLARKIILKIVKLPFSMMIKYVCRKYKVVLVNSNEVRSRIVENNLVDPHKINIVHPGVDYDSVKPNFVYEKYFLVPGRITWTKNLELAIEAFKEFKKQYTGLSKFKMVIAGSLHSKSNDYLDKIKTMAKDTEGLIEFKINPTHEEYDKLYENCYSVLFTPLNEDWGIVPLEAMMYAKPVIAVDSGGPKESIINGKNGFLCVAIPKVFSDKMILLAEDETKARAMGKYGRDFVKRFDWCKFVDVIDNFIDTIFVQKHD